MKLRWIRDRAKLPNGSRVGVVRFGQEFGQITGREYWKVIHIDYYGHETTINDIASSKKQAIRIAERYADDF